jgi:hypothetical protein
MRRKSRRNSGSQYLGTIVRRRFTTEHSTSIGALKVISKASAIKQSPSFSTYDVPI